MSTKHICSQKVFWRRMQNTFKNNTSVYFEDTSAKRFFDKKISRTEREMKIKHNFSNTLLAACREGYLNVIKKK